MLREKQVKIKVAIGEKVKKKDWDPKNQRVKDSCYEHESLNAYIKYLKEETEIF